MNLAESPALRGTTPAYSHRRWKRPAGQFNSSNSVIRIRQQAGSNSSWSVFNTWAANEVWITRLEHGAYRVGHRYNGYGTCRTFAALPFEVDDSRGWSIPTQPDFMSAYRLACELVRAYTPERFR